MLHAFDTLFTAGPCILGATVNKVLGRHGQTPFEAGEIDPWESSRREASEKGTGFVKGLDDKPNKRIPGRTIILNQNKWDVSQLHTFDMKYWSQNIDAQLFFHVIRWGHIGLLS